MSSPHKKGQKSSIDQQKITSIPIMKWDFLKWFSNSVVRLVVLEKTNIQMGR